MGRWERGVPKNKIVLQFKCIVVSLLKSEKNEECCTDLSGLPVHAYKLQAIHTDLYRWFHHPTILCKLKAILLRLQMAEVYVTVHAEMGHKSAKSILRYRLRRHSRQYFTKLSFLAHGV